MTHAQLKKAREQLGFSQSDLAREFGVSLRTIQRWEADEWPVPKWVKRTLASIGREAQNA